MARLLWLLCVACAVSPVIDEQDDDVKTCTNPYERLRTGRPGRPPTPWTPDVMVGAIRYDAWSAADEGDGPNFLFRVLPQWFERAPFFTQLVAGAFHVDAAQQSVADRQIDYAYSRGIDYFAFVYSRFVTRDYVTGAYRPYAELGNLTSHWNGALGFERFQSSHRCGRPRFSLIVQPDMIDGYINAWNVVVSPETAWGHVVADLVAQYARPYVHTTATGRPILFFYDGFAWKDVWGGQAAVARAHLEELRAAFVAAGLGSPYLVTLDAYPDRAAATVVEVGFDAASAYAGASPHTAGQPYVEVPFSQSLVGEAWYRGMLAASGTPVIPYVMAGWDSRPIEPWGRPLWSWYSHATPAEIVTSLRDAIDFVKAHPALSEARSVLVYAWDEWTEGGFLEPSLQEGTARLDAIAKGRSLVIASAVPKLPPVVRPGIANLTAACGDDYGVWIEADGMDEDVVLETRPAAVIADDEPFMRYTPTRLALDEVMVCFATEEERQAYDGEGVRITLVNPSRPSASATLVVYRGDDW
jgi:Glycosyltransferase WbsX